jgi:hypothetical protein
MSVKLKIIYVTAFNSSFINKDRILLEKYFNLIPIQGWVSNIVVLIFFGGILMSSIGLVARYVSVIVETSSGKPFFTIKNHK